jgi:hypothetical protein
LKDRDLLLKKEKLLLEGVLNVCLVALPLLREESIRNISGYHPLVAWGADPNKCELMNAEGRF